MGDQGDDPTFVPYRGGWRSVTFEHLGRRVTDRALVVWSATNQRLAEHRHKTYLKRLLNRLAESQKKLNIRRYKKRSYVEQRLATAQKGNPAKRLVDIQLSGDDGALELVCRINRERLAAAQEPDGRYPLVTNANCLAANDVLTILKGQDGVERRFRLVKGPLLVHPLFVRTDQRVEGLTFISLLARLCLAILERIRRQQGLQLTSKQLMREFATLQAIDLTRSDDSLQRRASEMTTSQQEILNALQWPAPEVYAQSTPLMG